MEKSNKCAISLVIFSISFFVSSIFIYHGLKRIGIENGSYVTVKGLSEKEIVSNSASWAIQYDIVGNSVQEITNLNNLNFIKVKTFFKKYGFNDSDIKIVSLNINIGNYRDVVYKYNASVYLSVTTNEIEKMEQVSKNIIELYNSGVLFTNYSGPKYNFDKINDIKPEMIADSIKNSKISALEFAKNSNSSLGKIKNASQGYFEFLPIDRSSKDHEIYPRKILRVVTTVSYYLK